MSTPPCPSPSFNLRRPPRILRASIMVAAAAVGLLARAAAADVALPDTKRIAVSVTFTTADKGHVVAFPSECTMGSLDLNLNPHLKFYPNYDVLDAAKPRAPYKFCGAQTALYVLDEPTFAKIKGPEEADWRRSEWRIEALDKIPINERAAFFSSNPGVHATGYTMPADGAISDKSPLAEVREHVTIAQGKATKIEITYLYTDAVQETFPYPVGQRPQPSRKEARDWMTGLSDAAAAPAATGSTSSSGSPPPAAPPAKSASCGGCATPTGAPSGGLFLTFVLGLGLAVARRRR